MNTFWYIALLGLQAPGVAASWWDDFSNNLFTDLTPVISLFGEEPTKQFLSESLTMLDYLISAMGPLGILTIVISAIRVRGGSSLRAFIGRAQEGLGNVESEVCSSTSRDICEMYNKGGIARVFGRPRMIELVYDPNATADEFVDEDDGNEATSGLYTFGEYEDYVQEKKGRKEWT
jgi:ankyrin repeat domain-containing protein 50